MNISAIILAAGLSSRMGKNKLLLPWRGEPMLQKTLSLVSEFSFYETILVCGRCTRKTLTLPQRVNVIENNEPEKGQSHSLVLGTQAATGDGYLYFVGDQPELDTQTVLAVLAAVSPSTIVIPQWLNRPGHPAFFPAKYRPQLLAIQGDEGARAVKEANREACHFVRASSMAALLDIDTPEEYQNYCK